MRVTALRIEPFEFINILDFSIEKSVNEHVTARIVGIISAEKENEYVKQPASTRNVVINARNRDGEEKILFNGLVCNVHIKYMNELRTLVVEAISHSYLMDITEVTRTYQNDAMTYQDVTDIMKRDDENFAFLHPEFGGIPIGQMLVQYKETNKAFVQRIASKLNTCVVVDYALDIPYISIGMPKRRPLKDIAIQPLEYEMRKDVSGYLDLTAHNVSGVTERDAVCHVFKSREVYDLCDPIAFKGLELYVYSVSSKLEGEEIVHTYTLKEKDGFVFKEAFNNQIIGASLYGTVKEIQNDMVRVQVFGDVAQSELKWFSYSTIYSTPDGTGWYFMPEVGDTIRLHFPTEHESDAYVTSSVHHQHGRRSNPDVKHITTVHGKTVTFRPDSIFMSNGAGSSIELHDTAGIRLDTTGDINIVSDSNIRLHANGRIVVQGDKGVVVIQNGSVVNIADSIDMASDHVRVK